MPALHTSLAYYSLSVRFQHRYTYGLACARRREAGEIEAYKTYGIPHWYLPMWRWAAGDEGGAWLARAHPFDGCLRANLALGQAVYVCMYLCAYVCRCTWWVWLHAEVVFVMS